MPVVDRIKCAGVDGNARVETHIELLPSRFNQTINVTLIVVAVRTGPQSAAAHNTLGTVLYRLGRASEAKASFTRALQVDATAWYALANLCHVNMNAGDTKTAIDQCHKSAALRKHAGSTK